MMRMIRMLQRCHFIVLSLAWAGGVAQAQEYPAKPIRVVIPFAAGNTGETSFRLITPILESRLGQRFLLDNRPGASGNTGALDAAKAAPDGYTIQLGTQSTNGSNKIFYPNLPYDRSPTSRR